ncbi:MAG: XrtB/PEP-CTERM-associated polysaccharide biosynthesis outer membrane protein EpsL [Burkholderiales bacterium]
MAGVENDQSASITSMTSECRSVVPPLDTRIGVSATLPVLKWPAATCGFFSFASLFVRAIAQSPPGAYHDVPLNEGRRRRHAQRLARRSATYNLVTYKESLISKNMADSQTSWIRTWFCDGGTRTRRRSWWLVAASLATCTGALQTASAQSQSVTSAPQGPLQFSVGTSVLWDDNVFRLSDSADTRALLGKSSKSDRYVAAFAGVHVDKPYAQQRFKLNATETAYRYDSFSFLNSNALNYDGAWDWHFTPRLSGTLSADRAEALANYGDYRTPIRNVVTAQNQRLSIDDRLSGGWHLLGGASHGESNNSTVFVQQASYRGNGLEGGTRYVTEAGNSVTFVSRSFRADYVDQPLDPVNLLDEGYRRRENELAVSWMPSGKSTLTGTATRIDYKSRNFEQRDFSGTSGLLSYRWQPTGRLILVLSAVRTVLPYIDNFSTYVVTDTVTVAPTWQVSAHAGVRAGLSRSSSDFRGAVVPVAIARQDDLESTLLALDWSPRKSLMLSADVRHERRTSNTAGFDYNDSSARVSVALTF